MSTKRPKFQAYMDIRKLCDSPRLQQCLIVLFMFDKMMSRYLILSRCSHSHDILKRRDCHLGNGRGIWFLPSYGRCGSIAQWKLYIFPLTIYFACFFSTYCLAGALSSRVDFLRCKYVGVRVEVDESTSAGMNLYICQTCRSYHG